MDIKFEKTNECEGTFRTYANAAEVAEKRKNILSRLARSARIPGFRPGKVPMSLISKHFRKDAEDALLTRFTEDAHDLINSWDADIKLVRISDPEINKQEDGAYELLFFVSFVSPFKLPRYEDIEVSQVNNDVDEAEVSDFLLNIAAREEVIYTDVDRPATMDDRVIFDFKSTVEGQSLSEFCGHDVGFLDGCSDYELKLNDSSMPSLSQGLVGAVAGDERVVDIDLDENFHIPELRGKHVVFTCKITKVQSIQAPDVESAAFASAHGAPNSPALRSQVRTILEEQKRRSNTEAQKRQIFNFIAAHADFPLPQSLVDVQTDVILNRSRTGASGEEMTRDDARVEAVKFLHAFLTLHAIAENEGISVTENELVTRLTEMYVSEGEQNIKSYIRKLQRENRMDSVHSAAMIDKTLDFLLKKTRVVSDAETPISVGVPSEAPAAELEPQANVSPEAPPAAVAEQQQG